MDSSNKTAFQIFNTLVLQQTHAYQNGLRDFSNPFSRDSET